MRVSPYLKSALVGLAALVVFEMLLVASFFYGTVWRWTGGYAEDAVVDSTSLSAYLMPSYLFAWSLGVVAFVVGVCFTLPQRGRRTRVL